jgi:hypothetical protein
MKIKDVKVNEFYLVQYDYKMKPCDCPCHTNDKILDMAPCCQDDSYTGAALCIEKKGAKARFAWDMYRNTTAHLSASNIFEKCEDQEQIDKIKRKLRI